MLDLGYNRIGVKGAQHIVSALETNTVRFILDAQIFHLSLSDHEQTLTSLELGHHGIAVEDVEHFKSAAGGCQLRMVRWH
jgi:hypothetical protein